MKIKGKVWKFGDDLDTNQIAGNRATLPRAERAKYCMEQVDPHFASKVTPGDIIVAGKNFGCGSSRESAVHCVKDVGIAAVIAPSFSRIYSRNAINVGLPILECEDAPEKINEGDIVEIDLEAGIIKNLTNGQECKAAEFPPFLQSMMEVGGLIPYVRAKLAAGSTGSSKS